MEMILCHDILDSSASYRHGDKINSHSKYPFENVSEIIQKCPIFLYKQNNEWITEPK